MKKPLLTLSLVLTHSFLIAQATDLFFSEYLEGASNTDLAQSSG